MTLAPQSAAHVMALDVGDRRIGVAMTDALGLTAQPLLTVHRTMLRADLKSLARLVRRHDIREVVIGHPVQPNGEPSAQTQKVEKFAAALREHFAAKELAGVTIHLLDERYTTAEAHALLDRTASRRSAADRKRRSEVIDQVAAVLILEAYLAGDKPQLLPPPPES